MKQQKKILAIKKAIKNKSYDMNKAIKSSADKIARNPWALLVR